MSLRRVLVALCLAAALAACQTTGPPAGGGGEAPKDLVERYVHQVVGSLRDSFVARDSGGFMKFVADGYYKGYDQLRQELELEFSQSSVPYLEAAVEEVNEEELRITALVSWARSTQAGEEAAFTGKALLIFHKGETLSLVDVRNGSLFGVGGF